MRGSRASVTVCNVDAENTGIVRRYERHTREDLARKYGLVVDSSALAPGEDREVVHDRHGGWRRPPVRVRAVVNEMRTTEPRSAGPGRVLTVCTGNVCRSPYMERRLRQALLGTGVEVESAGTGALVGADIEAGSASLLADAGACVEVYEARQISRDLVASADLVLTAAREHRGAVVQYYPKALAYTFTWGDFVDLVASLEPEALGETAPGRSWVSHVAATAAQRRGVVLPRPVQETDIPDPYRRGRAAFARMADSVEFGLPSIVAALTPPRRG